MSDNWEAEAECLRQFCSRQQEEIENLRGMADAVEVLRDIGKVFGCGHVDDPDGRRQLCNCIEQEFDKLNSLLGDSAFYIRRLARLSEGHASRIDRRALEFVKKRLLGFERVVRPMNEGNPV